MTRYEIGFMNKCAEHGVDGRVLIKRAFGSGEIKSPSGGISIPDAPPVLTGGGMPGGMTPTWMKLMDWGALLSILNRARKAGDKSKPSVVGGMKQAAAPKAVSTVFNVLKKFVTDVGGKTAKNARSRAAGLARSKAVANENVRQLSSALHGTEEAISKNTEGLGKWVNNKLRRKPFEEAAEGLKRQHAHLQGRFDNASRAAELASSKLPEAERAAAKATKDTRRARILSALGLSAAAGPVAATIDQNV